MKIDIFYTLYTDGDYCLKEPEKFGGIRDEDESYLYNGSVTFIDKEVWRCKNNAKDFLWKFLCEGIHVSYTHPWLIEDFYHCIRGLVDDIDAFESGSSISRQHISGNYDGTILEVFISE